VDPELAKLERDLSRFEHRTRLFGAAGVAAAIIAAVLCVGARQAQSQQEALSARGVVLVDNAGRQRIVLGSDTTNRPGIWLRDENGKDRLWFGFGAQRGTPQLSLNDETGRARFAAGFNLEHADPQIALFDPAGTPRAYLGFGVQLRTPQLVLNDEHGKQRLYSGWAPDGAVVLHLVDDSGAVVWSIPAGGHAPNTNHKSGGP
jgi:hypothetical protein